MTGMPHGVRVANGFHFIEPFIWNVIPLIIIAAVGLIVRPAARGFLLISIPLALIIYQVWIGGDIWNYWRIVAPGIPFLAIVLAGVLFATLARILNTTYSHRLVTAAIVAAGVLHINLDFLPEIVFRDPPFDHWHNRRNVNWAVALNAITTPGATVGVFSAGSLPYYADRYSIDFLGRSDRYIAHLPPDLSGSLSGNRMTSLPGHNKYDLQYSIMDKEPTYVMALKWGRDDVRGWARGRYVRVDYRGVKLYVRRDSQHVKWDLVEVVDFDE